MLEVAIAHEGNKIKIKKEKENKMTLGGCQTHRTQQHQSECECET